MKTQHKKIVFGALGVCCLAALGLTLGLVDCEGGDEGTRGDDQFPEEQLPEELPPPDDILTAIPDPAFNAYCVEQMTTWDTNHDGELSPAEAAAVTSIRVTEMSIGSMEGIEYFTGLVYLHCDRNNITSLDVSKLQNLQGLDVIRNKITSIEVTDKPLLRAYYCDYNQLSSIELKDLPALISFSCSYCPLTSLDLSGVPTLQGFSANYCLLSSINLTGLTKLQTLSLRENSFVSLDLSTNTGLAYLECDNNRLTSLDVSNSPLLKVFTCPGNRLTGLDISKNTALEDFMCDRNPGNLEKFVVKAWFDNSSIPPYFPTGSWGYTAQMITIDYQKVN